MASSEDAGWTGISNLRAKSTSTEHIVYINAGHESLNKYIYLYILYTFNEWALTFQQQEDKKSIDWGLSLQEWNDYNLRWNESEYGGVKDLRITPNKIWRPDILMYNR